MKIRKVELTNYTQHRELSVEIDTNFIGIVGENGSGKSNFISSISDAITGDFHKKKSQIVTCGEKTGSIVLHGTFNDDEIFVLNKSLGTRETTLTINGKELVGADLVNAKILERLDCDKAFLSNMVFVKQEDILGILFGRPSEKNKLLQRFFGLEKAQKIDLSISSWLSTIPETVEIDEAAIKEEIDIASSTIKKETANKNKLEDELMTLREEIDESEEYIVKVEKAYEKAKAYERSATLIAELESEFAVLKKRKKEIVDTEQSRALLQNKKTSLSTNKEAYQSLSDLREIMNDGLKMMDKGSCSCSICGSSLDEEAIENISKKIDDAESRLLVLSRDIESKKIEIKDLTVEIQEQESNADNINRRYDYVRSQLDTLYISAGSSPPKRKAEEYLAALQEEDEKRIKASAIEAKIEYIDSLILMHSGIVRRCESSLAQSAKTKLDNAAIRSHKNKVSRLQGLFRHNGSATETYVNTKMRKMCSSINEYLSGFSATYHVKVDKNNDFICQFPDKTISSSELSGGQKVVLSLAFRFAACEVFTSRTNLIVLDEPTTWLDKKRIDSFGEILSSVKSMSQEKDLQVFIVTHEKTLMPNFDQVIEF